jgi:hypothetical protein
MAAKKERGFSQPPQPDFIVTIQAKNGDFRFFFESFFKRDGKKYLRRTRDITQAKHLAKLTAEDVVKQLKQYRCTGRMERLNHRAENREKTLVLLPEPLPFALHGHSVYQMLIGRGGRGIRPKGSSVVWQTIRAEALYRACWRCAACKIIQLKGLHCHEKWEYDEVTATVSLVGFEIHCAACHSVIHIGRISMLGDSIYEEVLAHFRKVNGGLTKKRANQLIDDAWQVWAEREGIKWKIAVAPELLCRYPQLERLPEFEPVEVSW